jgi:ABC-2 type transport system permease protein
VISVVVQRETGVFKRRRATPVPASVLIAGRALTAVAVSLTITAALVIVGDVAFGVHIAASAVPALIATALAGAAAFCVLGYALATAIRSADSAQPTIQVLLLPLYLGSGIFIPAANLPDSVRRIAELFPVERLADAFHAAYGGALAGHDLAVIGLWAAGGLAVALHRFRWTPTAP